MYDYLIVGSGLFGSVFAHEMHKKGKSCLVLERRPHVGGNIYCENKDGINIHTYGAHIFHTSNKKSGTMSISLSNLITTSILPLQTIKASSTIYPLT